jgi:hypothetical protein
MFYGKGLNDGERRNRTSEDFWRAFWDNDYGYSWSVSTPINVYDPQKYDLVPKQDYVDQQIEAHKKALAEEQERHERRVKLLEDELSSLKGQKKIGK